MLQKLNRRWFLFGVTGGVISTLAGGALAGCGGGSGDSDRDTPATRLALLPRGGSWRYLIYPVATQETFIWTDLFYLLPGSERILEFEIPGLIGYDLDTPGALIRINRVTPFNVQLPKTSAYGGTFRQDATTGDLLLLRLPTGEYLDTPARILPGTWSETTAFTSPFLVGGQSKGEYSLTVTGRETTIPSELAPEQTYETWKTSIVATGAMSDLSGTFWYAPETAGYTQAIPTGVPAIDRKLQNYTINE